MNAPDVYVFDTRRHGGVFHRVRADAMGPPFTSRCGKSFQVPAAALVRLTSLEPNADICTPCQRMTGIDPGLVTRWNARRAAESLRGGQP